MVKERGRENKLIKARFTEVTTKIGPIFTQFLDIVHSTELSAQDLQGIDEPGEQYDAESRSKKCCAQMVPRSIVNKSQTDMRFLFSHIFIWCLSHLKIMYLDA